jgi:preprotein translocase subunit SecA
MRIFGSERMDTMLKRLGLKEDEAITHSWVTKALEKAQQKVEARNFEIRKNLLKYDDVMNDQRKVIYEQRRDLMQTPDVSETVTTMRHEVIGDLMAKYIPPNSYPEQWDTKGLHEETLRILNLDLPIPDWAKEEGIDDEGILERITKASDAKMEDKEKRFSPEIMRMVEKSLLLQILDTHWKEHLQALEYLRHGIGLRAYVARDVLSEYKREAFEMFASMLNQLRETVSRVLSHVEVRVQRPEDLPAQPQPRIRASHPEPASALVGAGPGPVAMPAAVAAAQTAQIGRGVINPDDPSTWTNVNRNAACPCGSGKKYKYCHGKA